MPRFLTFFLLTFACLTGRAQVTYFPPVSGNTWDTLSPESLGWCTSEIPALYDFLATNDTKAFMVLKDGRIVMERYFGSFQRDSLWYWASAGKTLTSFLAGIAHQEGKLDLDAPTSDYLGPGWTSCTPEDEEAITVRHQLTMTSGLNDGVPDHYCTLDTCLVCIAPPGTRWAYHNGPYTLLDGVIENATGQNLNLFHAQRVKLPTGMTGLFVKVGYNNVYFSTARSMARFGLLILNKGVWNGKPIMTDSAYFHQMVNTSQSLNKSYGYLWWLNGKESFMAPGFQFVIPGPLSKSAPSDMVSALGKNGQILNVVPSENLVVLRLGDEPGSGEVGFALNESIWTYLNAIRCASGVESAGSEPSPTLTPNPVQQRCTVRFPGRSFRTVVSDLSGRPLMDLPEAWEETDIDLADVPGGLYLVRILMADKPPVSLPLLKQP